MTLVDYRVSSTFDISDVGISDLRMIFATWKAISSSFSSFIHSSFNARKISDDNLVGAWLTKDNDAKARRRSEISLMPKS